MTRLKLNISHIVPAPADRSLMHGLYGYKEVIETIRWGLIDIGCDVTVSDNTVLTESVNIILGAQMLTEDDLRRLPADTIIYNFEQMAGRKTLSTGVCSTPVPSGLARATLPARAR